MGACCSSPAVENGSTQNIQPKKQQPISHSDPHQQSAHDAHNASSHHQHSQPSYHNNNPYPVQSPHETHTQTNNGPLAPTNNAQNIPWQQRYEFAAGILGKGHFAQVKKCRDVMSGKWYACKIIDKKELVRSSSSAVKLEIEILKAVGYHPNVVQLMDQFEDDKKFYLVMELCEGGDLFSQIVEHGKYSEKKAAKACRQLASALLHIHQCGVTHRDLKPENLLLTTPNIDADLKVADFGLSKLIKGHQHPMRTVCGTWAYASPEVIQRKPYDERVDNWTLGVLMYILLSGYHPFDVYGEMPEPELLQKIVTCSYDFDDPVWESISLDAKELIKGLLVVDPNKRLTLEKFLSSAWVSGACAEKPMNPMIIERLSKFSVGRQKFRTLVVAKLASNKFKASISRSKNNQQNNFNGLIESGDYAGLGSLTSQGQMSARSSVGALPKNVMNSPVSQTNQIRNNNPQSPSHGTTTITIGQHPQTAHTTSNPAPVSIQFHDLDVEEPTQTRSSRGTINHDIDIDAADELHPQPIATVTTQTNIDNSLSSGHHSASNSTNCPLSPDTNTSSTRQAKGNGAILIPVRPSSANKDTENKTTMIKRNSMSSFHRQPSVDETVS